MKIKITPLDIRKKTFDKTLRGYNKEDVATFLHMLSQEWERMQDDIRELHGRLTSREREVAKLREVEDSLYKTLKTAENTGANVIEQAHREADLQLQEAQAKAKKIIDEAEVSAKNKIAEAQHVSKKMLDDMEQELIQLVKHYKTVLKIKQTSITGLKQIADDLIRKINRAKEEMNGFDVDQYMDNAKQQQKEITENIRSLPSPSRENGNPYTPITEKLEQQQIPDSGKSFFDEI